jgi:hypothetical protein
MRWRSSSGLRASAERRQVTKPEAAESAAHGHFQPWDVLEKGKAARTSRPAVRAKASDVRRRLSAVAVRRMLIAGRVAA